MLTSPLAPADFSLLSAVISAVSRTSGLPPEEAEDFSQHVHLMLLERNYAPLARFAGRSSFRTFLTVVVRRQLLDWRDRRYGKWRPCEAARRLGATAIDLDRLVSRDGLQVEEAVRILAARPDSLGEARLRELASQLPMRVRVRTVTTDDFDGVSVDPFVDPIEATQAGEHVRALRARLRAACLALPVDDRRLLHLRYVRGLKVSAIAPLLGVPAKPLYRRLEQLVATLRAAVLEGEIARPARPACVRRCLKSRPRPIDGPGGEGAAHAG